MPKPDEENEVRASRLRFGPGGGAALQSCGAAGEEGHTVGLCRTEQDAPIPGAILTHPLGSARTAPASPPVPAAGPPSATRHRVSDSGQPPRPVPLPSSPGPAHPKGRQAPAGGAMQLPHQPYRTLPRHSATPSARAGKPGRPAANGSLGRGLAESGFVRLPRETPPQLHAPSCAGPLRRCGMQVLPVAERLQTQVASTQAWRGAALPLCWVKRT